MCGGSETLPVQAPDDFSTSLLLTDSVGSKARATVRVSLLAGTPAASHPRPGAL